MGVSARIGRPGDVGGSGLVASLDGGGLSLRDLFAAHVAASLATRVDTSRAIAEKAYDLADALLRERERRVERDTEVLVADAAPDGAAEPAWLDFELGLRGTALLDEPMPSSERGDEPDARWLEREDREADGDDPRWERGPVASAADLRQSVRPGLARTTPAVVGDESHEKTG